MLFAFGLRSSLLLPFVVPGAVATLWLLARAARGGRPADALLALLLLLPTLSVSQWMLGYAGWYDSHDAHSTAMFYVPWRASLLLGPGYYLYFRSLTNQDFRWRPALRHLLPGLLEWGAFAAVAAYDLLWYRGLRGRPLPDFFGTKGAAATLFDELTLPQALLSSALLLYYGWRMRAEYRRYRHYLDDNFSDPERLRFAGLRQLLALQTLVLLLGLVFTALNQVYDFSYDAAWYFFALRGVLIYGLIAVGLQANYAAATSPLRFRAEATGEAETPAAPAAGSLPAPGYSAAPPAAPQPAPAGAAGSAAGPPEEASGPLPTSPTRMPPTPAAPGPGAPAVSAAAFAPDAAGASDATSPLPSAAAALTDEVAAAQAAPEAVAAAAPDKLPAELAPWREKLLRLMAEEQPWLEPELTLSELAHRLRTNPAVLSRVINAGCGQNFNDFVNTYRVHEARRKLADARFAHYSLVGVALESGFNSKSTFNRVFKKLLGQAPSEVARPKS